MIDLSLKLNRILVVPPFYCKNKKAFCNLFDIFGSDGSNEIVTKWYQTLRESVFSNLSDNLGFLH